MPLTAYSGGLFEEVSGSLFKSKGSADEEALMVQRYGADSATRAERDQIWTRFSFAEDKRYVLLLNSPYLLFAFHACLSFPDRTLKSHIRTPSKPL